MAVVDTSHKTRTRFIGLSTDDKPDSAMIDSTFFETDTKHTFVWDQSSWTRILDFESIRYADGPNMDAFSRLRVSNPLTLFDSKQIFDNQPLFWDEKLESGADIASSHSTAEAQTTITSTVSTAGKFTRQTFMRFNYQPGKSQLITMTGVLNKSGGGTGVQRRIGIFDDDNGFFFEDDEGTIKVVLRSKITGSVVDSKVSQANWNLDTMDGTGTSGINMDFTKAHIWLIDFEWLGVGRARLGMFHGGLVIYVHQFQNDNTVTSAYMSTPNLPLRYQMITTSSSPASSMSAICATVIAEGGVEDLGVMRCASTSGTHIDGATENTLYAIVGIRLKSTHLGAEIKLVSTSIAEHAGNKKVEWQIIFNGTVAGTPSWGNVTNSAIQSFLGESDTIVTSGFPIGGGYFSSANKGGAELTVLFNALRLGAKIDGTVDEIVLAARPVGGSTNIDLEGTLIWREMP
jgi:hypothetical protein